MGTDVSNQVNVAGRPGVPSPKARTDAASSNQAPATDSSQSAPANAAAVDTAGAVAADAATPPAPQHQHHNQLFGFVDGFVHEGVDTVKGLVTVVTHPIKTAKGLVYMATHPVQAVQAIVEPYTTAWKDGRYGELAGRASFEALTILLTSGIASGASKGAHVGAEGAQVADRASEGASAAAKAADASNAAAKAADVSSAAAKVADVSSVATKAAKAGKGAEAAGAATKAAEATKAADAAAMTEQAAAKAAASAANKLTLSLAQKLAKEGATKAPAVLKELHASGTSARIAEVLKANPELLQRVGAVKHLSELSAPDAAALDAIERGAVQGAATKAGETAAVAAGTKGADAVQTAEKTVAHVKPIPIELTPGQKLDAMLNAANKNAGAIKKILDTQISVKGAADASARAVGQLVDGTGQVICDVYDAGGKLVTNVGNAVTDAAVATGRGVKFVANSVVDGVDHAGQAIADGTRAAVNAKISVGSLLAAPVMLPLGAIKLAADHPLVLGVGAAVGQLNTAGQTALNGAAGGDPNNNADSNSPNNSDPSSNGTQPTAPTTTPDAPSTTPSSDGKFRMYKLQPGDTLETIAQKELGDKTRWQEIYTANKALFDNLGNNGTIAPGTEIKIPVDAPAANKPTPKPVDKPATPVAHKPAPTPAPTRTPAPTAPAPVGPVKATPGSEPTRSYTVVKGDSLTGIADSQLNDWRKWREIQQLNTDRYPSLASNPDFLAIGWNLNLPPVATN